MNQAQNNTNPKEDILLNTEEHTPWWKILWEDYKYIPFAAVAAYLFAGVIFIFGIIPTASMSPTFTPGSLFAGYRLATSFERGDTMLFWFNDIIYCKRVIGLPGETITFSDGFVYIDGEKYDESAYLDASVTTWPVPNIDVFEVPENGYFMMGDNRFNSYDSRYWDDPYVYFDAVVGKILVTVATPLYD